MTEAGLQAAITSGTHGRPGLCKLLGLLWFHPHDSRRSTPGWPDLAICGERGFIVRELKSGTGTTTAAQDNWGWHLRNAGVDWDVWRPADLQSGRILAELRKIA